MITRSMYLQTMFPTWEAYCEVLGRSLMTHDYNEKYPEYASIKNSRTCNDSVIIQKLINANYDPQEGLERFIQVCLTRCYYLEEMMEGDCMLQKCVDVFMKAGAKITPEHISKIFSTGILLFYDNSSDLTSRLRAQGFVLRVLTKYGVDFSLSKHGWDDIIPLEWEDERDAFYPHDDESNDNNLWKQHLSEMKFAYEKYSC